MSKENVRKHMLLCVIAISFVVKLHCQCPCDMPNVIVIGERSIDSFYTFTNPIIDLSIPPHHNHNKKLYRKSFKNSPLRMFYSTLFDTCFFDKKNFSHYDLFSLLPTSYIQVLYEYYLITPLVSQYIDDVYMKRIKEITDKRKQKQWHCVERNYNGSKYTVCYHLYTTSYLEIMVNASFYTMLYNKYVSSDPPTCFFCDRKEQDFIYLKILLPMSENDISTEPTSVLRDL